jgi:UPF0271 protein
MEIDLNADLGEGAGTDAALMPLITSANISCGGHAGDESTIHAALRLARQNGVRIGAHPGYPDRANFGRTPVDKPSDELTHNLIEQVRSLVDRANELGLTVAYLKPHGALYNQAAVDASFAEMVCAVAAAANLPLVGLPESRLETICLLEDIPFYSEGFADRRYNPDGTLVPRSEPDALLHDSYEIVEQVEWLVGTLRVRTICVHGDTPDAVALTESVRDQLMAKGITIKAFV